MKSAAAGVALAVFAAFGALAQTGTPPASAMRNWRISGTVVHLATGEPLGGIEVTISPTEQRDQSMVFVTGSNGRFAFENLSRGKYSLLASGRGFTGQAYQQHGAYSTAIAVGPGLKSESIVFRLVPDASISGRIVDEENDPVRPGEVLLFARSAEGENSQVALRARSNLDEQGRYHFSHLPPGTYYVAIVAQPWYAHDSLPPPAPVPTPGKNASVAIDDAAPTSTEASDPSPLDVAYRTTFYGDATEAENAAPIQLRPGDRAIADVTLRAVPALHLTIRNVVGDSAQPANAFVQQRLFDATPAIIQSRSQQVSPGVVSVSGIPPGRFFLTVRKFTGKEWASESREIEVTGDTEIDASEAAPGPVFVRGVAQFSGGAPLPAGAYIRFFNRATNDAFGAALSPTGTFEAQQAVVGAASYEVSVLNLPDSMVAELAAEGATVVGRTLQLPRAGAVQLKVTLSQAFARIDGTVRRGDKAVSEAMVLLVPDHLEGNKDLFRRDQSDSDGTFSLYQVLPGRYVIVAIENGWDLDWQNPAVLRPYLARGEPVEVTATRTQKVSVTAQSASTKTSGAP